MKKNNKAEKEEGAEKAPKEKLNQLEQFLKDNEKDHYNFVIPTFYQISTGSILLDSVLEGGLPPGIHRVSGSSEGGKTSFCMEACKNFLETVPNSKALYIKAEGRFSKKMKKRSEFQGVKFVDNPKDWDVGTVFILKSNIYDSVAQFINELVKFNENDFKYFFILDSLDSLMLRADTEKPMDGKDSNVKVAGPNVLTKRLFKLLSLPITEYGHMMLVVTQIIGEIKDKYDVPDQLNVSGGGGNAAIHFASFIISFLPRTRGDYILSSGDKAILEFDEANIIGHWAKVCLEKTENEKTNIKIKYPIRYGSGSDAGGVWSSMEIKKMLEVYRFISGSSWLKFSDDAREKMKEGGIDDVPENFHGAKALDSFISKPEVLSFWKRALLKQITSADVL